MIIAKILRKFKNMFGFRKPIAKQKQPSAKKTRVTANGDVVFCDLDDYLNTSDENSMLLNSSLPLHEAMQRTEKSIKKTQKLCEEMDEIIRRDIPDFDIDKAMEYGLEYYSERKNLN